jgi:GxxExxY protein
MKNDKLTEKIIGACYEVHNHLGPGFNEKAYKNALKLALNKHNLKFKCEKNYSVYFHGFEVGNFRADLVIEDKIIVEIKAVQGFMPKSFESQVIAYLKASKISTGLLINFGNRNCIIRRIMNNDPFNIDNSGDIRRDYDDNHRNHRLSP